MEFNSCENVKDKVKSSSKNGMPEDIQPEVPMIENSKQQPELSAGICEVPHFEKHMVSEPSSASVDVNAEASVTADEVMRAGGFGATDSISSFIAVASDSSAFEVHLREVQDYEDLNDETLGKQLDSFKDTAKVHKVASKEAHSGYILGKEDLEDKFSEQSDPPEKIRKVDIKHVLDFKEHAASPPEDGCGEVNMEASVTSDEVTRAGGFGATDDISSFLPVASDFTDFEAHMRDARDYEDSKEEINRPGLGWSNETK